ncbi:ankyrin repeat domain-containing protein [Fusarium circinatum]|uniref:Ankyrin repeat domain-containing protein n=1 Tax=Fusarium circinatum TaxID=48490 RepID=A0A8H5UC21_FUSCI|nr:ankyrin repeat domain-containing protein [Fusarium circinatum]
MEYAGDNSDPINPSLNTPKMTYTNRHMRRPGRKPALYFYIRFGSRDTPPGTRPASIPSYQPELFKRSKEDEAQLKQLRARHSQDWSQIDAQAYEDIMDRDAAKSDASKEPLRLIIYSYFEHLNLPPLPPPLPGCSTSVLFKRAENHSNESVRPFMVACDKGLLDEVKAWTQGGERIEKLQQLGLQDGLVYAARANEIEVVRYLLDERWTPLNGEVTWISKATPPMDRTSGLALDLAVEKSPMIVVQMLLEYGAHPQYSRPPHGAIKRLHRHSVPGAEEDWRPLMEMALNYGAEINARTYSGGTALSRAVHCEDWEIVEFLIEKGADPFVKCPSSKHDSFDSALKFEDQPWQRSKGMKEYLKSLMSGTKMEIRGEAQEEARKNPLVRIIEKVKSRDMARLEIA